MANRKGKTMLTKILTRIACYLTGHKYIKAMKVNKMDSKNGEYLQYYSCVNCQKLLTLTLITPIKAEKDDEQPS